MFRWSWAVVGCVSTVVRPLLGVVDLISEVEEGQLIVDFKTTASGGTPPEVVHEVQLSTYAYLARHATGQTEAGLEIRSIVKTKTPKIQIHRYHARTDVHFRRLFAIVRAYLDNVYAGQFTFRPNLLCTMCEFRDAECCDWSG